MDSTPFLVIAISAIAIQAFILFLSLFEPGLPYEISDRPPERLDSGEFVRLMEMLGNTHVDRGTRIDVLRNGELFYEAELEAIRAARRSIHLEAYIFQKGKVARRFLDALVERARAGVRVRIVLDAVGSCLTWNRLFRELRGAGGRVAWYHPLRWHTWPRFNNRTHRELVIVDGEVAFVGGAGIADHWMFDRKRRRRWRDTMFRVEGEAVATLQSTFSENWLEASGELLTDLEAFTLRGAGETPALVVGSSPSTGGSTRARMIFQTLIAAAQQRIIITTPYFLPDRSARREIVRAIRERGVEVAVLTPGQHHDHLLTRRSSRRLYGELLKAGARIYEYEPSMIHCKTMVIDRLWSLVGSTNCDHRSFGLNDEVNVAALDEGLAARLEEHFASDLASSRSISYQAWRRRSPFERVHEWLGWVLERQQ